MPQLKNLSKTNLYMHTFALDTNLRGQNLAPAIFQAYFDLLYKEGTFDGKQLDFITGNLGHAAIYKYFSRFGFNLHKEIELREWAGLDGTFPYKDCPDEVLDFQTSGVAKLCVRSDFSEYQK